MKLKKIIWIFVLLSLILNCAALTIQTSTPTIKVYYDEEVIIINKNLTNDLNNESYALSQTTQDNKTFEFTPIYALSNGNHTFKLEAKDIFGNIADEYILKFTINAPFINIKLHQPKFGVSDHLPFDVIINTSQIAICKYAINPNYLYSEMIFFTQTNNYTHKISNFNIRESKLYIKCKDELNRINENQPVIFDISYDNTAPKLTPIFDPNPIIELIDDRARTNLTLTTDDFAICKYSTQNINYSSMGSKFDNWNPYKQENFVKTHSKEFDFSNDTKNYDYYFTCENLAGLVSNPVKKTLTVNTQIGLTIKVNTPSPTKETNITLDISTNKRSKCSFTFNSTETLFPTTLAKQHSINIGTFTAGSHKFNITCSSAGEKVTKDFTLVIDLSEPSKVIFDEDLKDYTCERSNNRWRVRAEFSAQDNESGIGAFNYSLYQGNNLIFGWITATARGDNTYEAEVETNNNGDDLNLTPGKKYHFRAIAMNKVGIWNRDIEESRDITALDKLDDKCRDTNPPETSITTKKITNGVNITINCYDRNPGCDDSERTYGSNLVQGLCSETREYHDRPITLIESTYFCWRVCDTVNNCKTEIQYVDVNAMLNDADNDGIADDSDNCANTPSDEVAVKNGCSCSQLDEDKDNVNNCKDECPRTPLAETDKVNNKGCAPSERDSDGDGMPDNWEKLYDLDPYDPNDRDEDLDNDGSTNYEEYREGTDPTDPNSTPAIDSDSDGIVDNKDKCPNTPFDELANEDGCSVSQVDTDQDGIPDVWETQNNLDPNNPEDAYFDNDGEGLLNIEEYQYSTNPNNEDTDGDKFDDKREIDAGTDPNDPNSKPEGGSILSGIVSVLGTLSILGGGGYLGYEKYFGKKKVLMTSPTTKKTIIPQQIIKRTTIKKPLQSKTKTRQRPLQLLKRKKLTKEKKVTERSKLFDVFGKTSPSKKLKITQTKKPILKRITKPTKKLNKIKNIFVRPAQKKQKDIFDRLPGKNVKDEFKKLSKLNKKNKK